MCPNHYILFCGMFKGLTKYQTCGASRYKRSDNYREEDNRTKTGNKRRDKGGKKNVATQCLEELH